MSDFWLWLSGFAIGLGLGVHWMVVRQQNFYRWALREAQQYFDQLLAEWAAEQESEGEPALSDAPSWFPDR